MAENEQNPADALPKEQLLLQPIADELSKSYLDYAMSVIVGRALPDVRDGLKPVHRRILYAMNDLSMRYNQPYKKCARIVGEVLGKYHPHGDQSVYDALVRMGQDFSMRMPLVDGQGNFGSIDGDPPAAMRYTEARLARASDEMLQDIEKETVDFAENFDGSLKEPSVLPAKLPNLLLNGSSGIAVGMATNIPPHNLPEMCDALIALIEKPETEVLEIARLMPGPDFPTGGIVQGRTGIMQYYSSGRGKLRCRAVLEHEQVKDRERIIITEIPFMVNKATLIQQIADLVKQKKIEGISDIFDESDRKGMRVVIEIKRDATLEIVENQLYKHTNIQTTFGVNMIAIVDGKPELLGIKEVLGHYLAHRRIVVRRRTQYDLGKAEEKEHLLQGLVVALNNIDPIVEFLRKTRNVEDARAGLIERYGLSERQANAILEMRLARLTGLEQEKIRADLEETRALIERLKEILASEEKILDIIKAELIEIKERYPVRRKTRLLEGEEEDIDLEDLIEPEDVVVTISNDGYCKRLPVSTYRSQHRGGKGIVATKMKDEDYVRHLFIANTHTWLLVFTDKGRVYWVKVYTIPEGSRQSKGKPIINIVNVAEGERVRAVIPVKEFSEDKYLLFATRNGIVKKTVLSAYGNVRQTGIIAINLLEGDNLVDVLLTNGKNSVLIASAKGMAVKFKEEDVRPVGRNSTGVRGIRLGKNDKVIDAIALREESSILTVTENGYGKRTAPDEYRLINRGGKGVINIITSERNGNVVACKAVSDDEDIMLITKNGITIRTPVSGIRLIGRATQGVRIMDLRGDDRVVACTVIDEEEVEGQQDASSPAPPETGDSSEDENSPETEETSNE